MVLLLFFHISSLLIWAAALSMLLLLIPRIAIMDPQSANNGDRLDRLWFTRLASPAGLIAIVSGTAIFVLDSNFNSWLLLKLTLVTGLVICHVAAGLMILYQQRPQAGGIAIKCAVLLLLIWLLMLSIIVLVLAKPDLEALLWFA